MHFDPFCFCLFWWKISRSFKSCWLFLAEQKYIWFRSFTKFQIAQKNNNIILLWSTILGNYSFYWQLSISKQNSTFVAEFNSNVKIYAASSPATGLIALMWEDGYVAAKKDKNSKMLLAITNVTKNSPQSGLQSPRWSFSINWEVRLVRSNNSLSSFDLDQRKELQATSINNTT